MSTDTWTDVTMVAPEHLRGATLELHWALQYLAAAGQTFVEPRADDSHRAARWDAGLRAFVGEPFAGAYPFRLALRPEDLTLLLIDRTGADLAVLPLRGRLREEGFEWLSLGMATYLGGAPPIVARPEYEMPAHPVASDAPFSADLDAELRTLAALYHGAAALLEEVVRDREDASIVRCWPHHFDIATLLTPRRAAGGDSSLGEPLDRRDPPGREATVGVGFAPMGGGYDEWYWYVSPWPAPAPSALSTLPRPGVWHTEGWTGAVLLPADVVPLQPTDRAHAVRGFFTAGIEASLEALAREAEGTRGEA